jgi:hypothetical protein
MPPDASAYAGPERRAHSSLRLGWISSVQQLFGDEMPQHRITVETWSAASEPVELSAGNGDSAADGYLMQADLEQGQGLSLFAAPGRLTAGARVLLKCNRDDVTVAVGDQLGAGPGFERYSVRPCGSARL